MWARGTEARAEAHMVGLAEEFDPPTLKQLGRRLFEVVCPEAADQVEGKKLEKEEAKARARRVFERAHGSMKEKELKEERVSLLNAWLSFERTHGGPADVDKVQKQMPRKVKRRRRLEDDTFEEYVDYVFPADDEQKQDMSKMLAMAQAWKQAGRSTA